MTQHVFTDKHQSSRRSSDNLDDDRSKVLSHHLPKSSNIVDKNNSSLSETINEPGSRIEFLERNLRYIQEQQEIVLVDLHNEISRLQQENRGFNKFNSFKKKKKNSLHLDLHYRLIKTYSLSSTEQKQRNIDQLSSSSSPNKSNHDKLENQIYLKQHIDKLEKQLIESEQKNKYLMNTIDELNDTLSSKIEIPNINISNKDDIQIPIQTTNNECQHLFNMTFEKEQQYIHELFDNVAPRTCSYFRTIISCKSGYGFQNSKFDYLVVDKYLQGGEVMAFTRDGTRIRHTIKEETNDLTHNREGLISMNIKTTRFGITLGIQHDGTGVRRAIEAYVVDDDSHADAPLDIVSIGDARPSAGNVGGQPIDNVVIYTCGQRN
ncbi:unnamed protein product [Rotaria sp. Silwood1]|nr:unnamed protein product [Rotaria sp. Silwood1]